jgi:hypothetical protein
MNGTANGAGWVILLGILSTTQTHLAKALERQGIETLDLVWTKLRRSGERMEGQASKPLIYVAGLALNHTTFVYHLFVAPLGGTTALYTSMYGIGLIALLLYSTQVMRERISSLELVGAAAILLGTLTVGLEGIHHPPLDMAAMDIKPTVTTVVLLLGGCLVLMVLSLRNGTSHAIGLAFGLSAGACGSLDPFLKAVGQTAGGGQAFAPHTPAGWIILGSSFLIGEAAVLVTQWGFYRRARANVLVPAYNCSYIAVPVGLQALLLPGYSPDWATGAGLALIMVGFALLRGFGRQGRAVAEQITDGIA